MIKANPYVYPYLPFKDLSNKKIVDNFASSENADIDATRKMLLNQKISVNFKEKEIAKKILEIFLHNRVCFGSKDLIKKKYTQWLQQLEFFITQNKKIEFSILGFPFKVPVPLKTNRLLPDLGEFLSLYRLDNLMDLINMVYTPGARATIFTEGVFGGFVGIKKIEGDNYRNYLIKLSAELKLKNIVIEDLGLLEKYVPNFTEEFEKEKNNMQTLYLNKDSKFMDKYQGTFPSVLRIVNTRKYDLNILMDVYNDNMPDDMLDPEAKEIRDEIKHITHMAIFNYHAYLQVRSKFNALNKYRDGIITMSVSPKENRLGVYPIDSHIERLPYHGVPVWHEKRSEFTIEYLIDIRRSSEKFIKMFLKNDSDDRPFYYIKK